MSTPFRVLLAAALVAGSLAPACGGKDKNVGVEVFPSSAEVATRTTKTFTAEVSGSFGGGVTWSLVVGDGTLSSNGVYSAPSYVPRDRDNEIVVRATSLSDPSVSDDAQVKIVPPPISPAQGPTAGGTRVTIDGEGFTSASIVTFGGVPGTDLQAESGSRLRVTTPDVTAIGPVDVRILSGGSAPAVDYPLGFTFGATHLRFPGFTHGPTCINPIDVLLADLDKDGFDDAVVACAIFRYVTQINDQRGGFGRQEILLPPNLPIGFRLASADFDGDLDLDVLAMEQLGSPATGLQIGVYRNDGGTLVPQETLPRPFDPLDLTPTFVFDDFAIGGSPPSIVFADSVNLTIGVAANNGSGGFTAPTPIPVGPRVPHGIGLPDGFPQDGVLDVAFTTDNGFSIRRSGGAIVDFPGPLGATSLAVGDFNADGIDDVVTSALSGAVTVRYGVANATVFGATDDIADPQNVFYERLRVANLDADLADELIAISSQIPGLRIFDAQPGTGLLDGPVVAGSEIPDVSAAVGNVDGDPGLDLVTVRNQRIGTLPALSIGVYDEASVPLTFLGKFGTYPIAGFPAAPEIVFPVAMINTQGALGIATIDPGSPSGLSNVRTISFPTTLTSATVVHVADVDGNGTEDVIVSDTRDDSGGTDGDEGAVWFFSRDADTGILQPPMKLHQGAQGGGVVIDAMVSDLDRDGLNDLVISEGTGLSLGTLRVRWGSAPLTFEPPVDVPAGVSPTFLAIADMDDDGTLDILSADFSGATIAILRINTNGTIAAPVFVDVGEFPANVLIADLDEDSIPDLIASCGLVSGGNSEIHVARGLGGGQYAQSVRYPIDHGLGGVALADLDGDGRLDIAGTSPDGVVVLRGLEGVNFDTPDLHFLNTPSSGLAVVDLDGDGLLDFVLNDTSQLALRPLHNLSR